MFRCVIVLYPKFFISKTVISDNFAGEIVSCYAFCKDIGIIIDVKTEK